jgi:hypothetical protein
MSWNPGGSNPPGWNPPGWNPDGWYPGDSQSGAASAPPTSASVDWKLLVQALDPYPSRGTFPSYEFSNSRVFTQPGDQDL